MSKRVLLFYPNRLKLISMGRDRSGLINDETFLLSISFAWLQEIVSQFGNYNLRLKSMGFTLVISSPEKTNVDKIWFQNIYPLKCSHFCIVSLDLSIFIQLDKKCRATIVGFL